VTGRVDGNGGVPRRGRGHDLDERRQARLRLAFDAAYDARHGDPAEYRRLLTELIELHARLWAEQLAEAGVVPSTEAARAAVLSVARKIEQERRRGR
jgi:hypothetical protein